MSFGGNTAPRRIIKEKPVAWICDVCDRDVKAFHNNCPGCGVSRPE